MGADSGRFRVVASVQARMGSSRLPGKALLPLNGVPALEWIVRRLRRAESLDDLAVTTGIGGENDPIANLCRSLGVRCLRGAESDLIARHLAVAQALRADAIVRVTGDCPLVQPSLVDAMVATWRLSRPDYCSNVWPQRTYPDGYDLEVFSLACLERLYDLADGEWRERLNEFIWNHPRRWRIGAVIQVQDKHEIRLTLDTSEDIRPIEGELAREAANYAR